MTGGGRPSEAGEMRGCGGGPRSANCEGRGRLRGGGGAVLDTDTENRPGEEVDTRGTLAGVADRMENRGGSAEKGRNELTLGEAGAGLVAGGSNRDRGVVKMGSAGAGRGVTLGVRGRGVTRVSGTKLLMVEGAPVWVRGGGAVGAGWSRARPALAASRLDLTRGTLPSGRTSGPENPGAGRAGAGGGGGAGRGDTKLMLWNWLRSSSTFLLPCFLLFSNLLLMLLLLLLFANFEFKFALTLGFFPSALINGGLSKGFTIGSSFTSSTMSLSSMKGATVVTVMENLPGLSGVGEGKELGVDWWRCCCRRLDFTRGLALKGRLVVVKPRGMGRGVVAEREERTSSSCK